MKSMTGYGSSKGRFKDLDLEVSVRCVNGRYLDVRTHLPKELITVEASIKEMAKRYFQRGTVDVFVQTPGQNGESGLDLEAARLWQLRLQELKKHVGVSGEVSIETLLHLPGVLRTTRQLPVDDPAPLLKVCEKALQEASLFRSREGKVLVRLIKGHLAKLEKAVKQVDALHKRWEGDLLKAFKARVKKESDRDAQSQLELKLNETLDRANIHEETSRLQEHLNAVDKLLGSDGGGVGKKLDFFAQEFLREINTIGSKSQTSDITALVIEGKSSIESFREQVQNLE